MEICDRYDVSKMADKAVKICFFGNKVIRIIKITSSKMNILKIKQKLYFHEADTWIPELSVELFSLPEYFRKCCRFHEKFHHIWP